MKVCYAVRAPAEREKTLAGVTINLCPHELTELLENNAAVTAALKEAGIDAMQPAWEHDECPTRCTHDEPSPHRITAVLAEDVDVPDHRRHRPR